MGRGVAAGADAPGVYAGTMLLLRAELNMLSGRHNDAELDLREARRHLRRSASSQFALPLAGVEAEFARSAGDLEAAREIVERVLARTDIGEEQRYKWPVLSLAARIEAERALTGGGDRDGERGVPAVVVAGSWRCSPAQLGLADLWRASGILVRGPRGFPYNPGCDRGGAAAGAGDRAGRRGGLMVQAAVGYRVHPCGQPDRDPPLLPAAGRPPPHGRACVPLFKAVQGRPEASVTRHNSRS